MCTTRPRREESAGDLSRLVLTKMVSRPSQCLLKNQGFNEVYGLKTTFFFSGLIREGCHSGEKKTACVPEG